MKQSVTELPFNTFLGLEDVADSTRLLRLPTDGRYLNHLGTVHAGALLALAEASSGQFLLRHFDSAEGVVPVVRHLEAKFRKPANGAVESTAAASNVALAKFDADLAAKGRALIAIAVELYDEAGTHALSATVEWFIQRLPRSNADV
ncbi:MAG: YiiD C-terminal domain-containing protein [Pirellulales bacterium]